jgi:hypothetical protein
LAGIILYRLPVLEQFASRKKSPLHLRAAGNKADQQNGSAIEGVEQIAPTNHRKQPKSTTAPATGLHSMNWSESSYCCAPRISGPL